MKLRGRFLKNRLAVGLVCALVAVYTLYHLIGLFDGEFSTFAAGVTTEHTTINYDGYIFCDETVLSCSAKGLADYTVADGTKVAEGQALATVYSGHAEQQVRLRRIDEQIALLESSIEGLSMGTDPSEIKASASTSYDTIIKMLASGESGGLSLETDRFLKELNRLDFLWQGEEAPGSKTLESLRTEREELIAACGNGVTYAAPKSGYFTSSVDGLEEKFTMEALENHDGDNFFSLISQQPKAFPNAYGKIAYTSEWCLVLPVMMEEQKYFEEGKTYEGLFEENNKTVLPLTVDRIIDSSAHDAALVVFSCDRMPQNFEFDRCQSVQITVDRVSGIYIPKDVVEKVDGMRGVYILRGSVVYFRQIDIVYEGSDYYLVKEGLEGDEEVAYLQVNDLIILHGKNLFDGRVVD